MERRAGRPQMDTVTYKSRQVAEALQVGCADSLPSENTKYHSPLPSLLQGLERVCLLKQSVCHESFRGCSFLFLHLRCESSSPSPGPLSSPGGVCVCGLVAQSCPTLCNLMDCSPPGSSVHGILQARILEWVAIPSSRGSSQFRDQIQVSHIEGRFFTS